MKTASWVVVDHTTRDAVLETYSRAVAARINRERYDVIPALQYLQGINRDIAAEGRVWYAS